MSKSKFQINGFTLIELIICVGIIAVVSSVVFWNGRQFNDKLEVSSSGEEVSLGIREAQNYGVSVRESSSGTGQFTFAYGVAFDLSNPTFVSVFADKNGNKIYDGGSACDGTDECVEKIPLRNGVKIKTLCAVNSLGTVICGANWKAIHITFTRPNLDATITVTDSSGAIVSGPWSAGQVTLSSLQGAVKIVSVNTTGQISVQ